MGVRSATQTVNQNVNETDDEKMVEKVFEIDEKLKYFYSKHKRYEDVIFEMIRCKTRLIK